MEELDITEWIGDPDKADQLGDAIDNASDQGKSTWLTAGGKRIAAIVPVDVADAAEQAMRDWRRDIAARRDHLLGQGR